VLILLGIGAWTLFFQTVPEETYEEVASLSGTQWSFQEYSTFFRELSEDKGAPYAFQVLRRAALPLGVDVHLLGHVVGDMLYLQEGIQGINLCTDDFRNACSHSVVIGVLTDEGPGALPRIADVCKDAPGGSGAYTMCFHGLGHGVLAFNGYNLERAIEMCEETGTPEYAYQEFSQCVGGTIMEMSAGVHDPEAWQSQVDKYFKDEDPLYPCTASFMPEMAKPFCYSYLTPHLFQVAGIALDAPDPTKYSDAFQLCASARTLRDREYCYGGFGKEFVVLAQGRDVRDVGAMDEAGLIQVQTWCREAGSAVGEEACHSSALASLFWGGEAVPDAAFSYCAVIDTVYQESCYQLLSNQIVHYLKGDVRARALCERLPEAYQSECLSKMY